MKRNSLPNPFLAYMSQSELQSIQKSVSQELNYLHETLIEYRDKRNKYWGWSDKSDSATTENFKFLNMWNDEIRLLKKEIAIKSKLSRMLKAASK